MSIPEYNFPFLLGYHTWPITNLLMMTFNFLRIRRFFGFCLYLSVFSFAKLCSSQLVVLFFFLS